MIIALISEVFFILYLIAAAILKALLFFLKLIWEALLLVYNDINNSAYFMKICGFFFAAKFIYTGVSLFVSSPILSTVLTFTAIGLAATMNLVAVFNLFARIFGGEWTKNSPKLYGQLIGLLLTSTTLLLSECYLIPFSFFSLPGLLGVAAYGIAFVAVIKISFDVPQTIEVVKQELNQLNTQETAKNVMNPLKVGKGNTSGTCLFEERDKHSVAPHKASVKNRMGNGIPTSLLLS